MNQLRLAGGRTVMCRRGWWVVGSTVVIQYDLAAPAKVGLRVYNVRGRLVRTLVEGVQPRGRYRAVWLGQDDRGVPVASGVYFVRMEADGRQMRQKVTLVR